MRVSGLGPERGRAEGFCCSVRRVGKERRTPSTRGRPSNPVSDSDSVAKEGKWRGKEERAGEGGKGNRDVPTPAPPLVQVLPQVGYGPGLHDTHAYDPQTHLGRSPTPLPTRVYWNDRT